MIVTDEQSPLLVDHDDSQRQSLASHAGDTDRALDRFISEDEQKLGAAYVGERLPYSDYSSIDFLHDLVSAPAFILCSLD